MLMRSSGGGGVQVAGVPPEIPDTVNWTAPELLDGSNPWPSPESDIWWVFSAGFLAVFEHRIAMSHPRSGGRALGCVIYEVFDPSLQPPFSEPACAERLSEAAEVRRRIVPTRKQRHP